MDAVKFVEERRRMFTVTGASPKYSLFNLSTRAEDVVKEVEAWSAAHPRKTRQSVFLEQWPDADIGENGVVSIAPCSFLKEYRKGPTWESKCHAPDITCGDCSREFWMQEVE